MRLIALDLVRFFAALSVVLYHYTAYKGNSFGMLSEVTKFGYLGFPLFFIISGYVITLSANNRSAFEFAISRFIRLYPAFWSGIAFTILITALYRQNNYTLSQILANLTMLNDYWGYQNIDGVYWTLQVELKFYVCVFLLILGGIFKEFKVWLSIWLASTILYLLTNQPFFMGWIINPFYSSFFIAGVAFYLIQKNGTNSFNFFILFSSLVISSFCGFNQALEFMQDPGIISQSISIVLIWLFYLLFYLLVTERVKLSKCSYYLTLGGLTYPLYLIHSRAGRTIINNSEDFFSEGVVVTITVILMLLFSYLIHIGIEKKVATPMKAQLLNRLGSGNRSVRPMVT